MLGSDGRCDPFLVVDPILERDHRRIGAEQRLETSGGRLSVVRLDAEQDDVDRSDRCRVVRRGQVVGLCLVGRLDGQATLANRIEVSTSGDEVDVGATVREARAVEGADPPGAVDGDPHR